MVQNLLNLTGVNRPSRKCECFAIAPTVLCVNRPHNINVILYSMFRLKAPLFKGVGGDPMLLNNPHFHLSYKKATIPQKKHSSPEILRAISHSECFIIALTVLCVNRLHNINAVLYSVSMFRLKAPLLKGVGGISRQVMISVSRLPINQETLRRSPAKNSSPYYISSRASATPWEKSRPT